MSTLLAVSLLGCQRPVVARAEAVATGVLTRTTAAPPLLEPKEILQGPYGFGFALAAGVFDADGVDDLAVGSQGADRVDVFMGVAGYSSGPADWSDTQPQWSQFGWAVAACDVDADGFDELVASSPDGLVLVY